MNLLPKLQSYINTNKVGRKKHLIGDIRELGYEVRGSMYEFHFTYDEQGMKVIYPAMLINYLCMNGSESSGGISSVSSQSLRINDTSWEMRVADLIRQKISVYTFDKYDPPATGLTQEQMESAAKKIVDATKKTKKSTAKKQKITKEEQEAKWKEEYLASLKQDIEGQQK